MNISWNGLGSIVLTAKLGQSEASLVTNPFNNVGGLKFPKSIAASIIVQTHAGVDTEGIDAIVAEHEGDKKPFVISHAGEYEIKGLSVTGIRAPKKDGTEHTIYRFDGEGIHVGFLGAIDRQLTSKEQELLGAIDILIIPAGGKNVLSASMASEVIAQIEPRMVIPIYVSAVEDDGFGDVSAFVREISVANETMSKLKIVKAGLPEEDMTMVILTRG